MSKETVLQFGAGNFLRAFVDLFVEEANRAGDFGKVVVVQSTGRERADALNAAGGRYHVALQGVENGVVVDRTEEVGSVSRALFAGTEWPAVLEVAVSPDLRWMVSNTTEAGFVLDDADVAEGGVPVSFPAKLLAALLERFRAGLPGLTILPCELIEANGTRLLALVMEQAARWQVDAAAVEWLRGSCRWVNNLVDRIVPGAPKAHPLLGVDPLLLAAEPFALWAIESSDGFELDHPAVVVAADIGPFYLRKVRILNGAHTALAAHALPLGLRTVGECVAHPVVGPWLEALLFEEIVPVLDGRVDDPTGFARATLDRFRNPFFEHALSAIALNHEAKLKTRLAPTLEDFRRLFGRDPQRIREILG